MKTSDNREYETKVVGINPAEVIQKLRSLGAKETPEFLTRRYVFDMESEQMEWIRLREGNGKTTITYKYKVRGNTKIGETIEIEVEVSDFDKAAQILHKLPFKRIFYQENKNHIFYLNGVEFSIDTWPLLDSYLEVESNSVEKIQEGLKVLDLVEKDLGDKDIEELYRDKGIDFHSYKELKFEQWYKKLK